jgi:NTP pyrophosphatase (non-canonical NTP hydrolase)
MSQRPEGLDEWQQMFDTIYCLRNKERNKESILLRLVEEISEVSEALREENFRLSDVARTLDISVDELKKQHKKIHVLEWELPDMFAWLCAFATCVNHELKADMWHKYPTICPYCLEKHNCLCIAKSPEEKPPKAVLEARLKSARNNATQPKSLREWQDLLDYLYKKINRVQEEEVIGFHLQEEVGELSRELRKMTELDRDFLDEDFSGEIADVFSWTLALASRMDLKMEEITWNKYPRVCPYCGQPVCKEHDGE